ncbi:zf-HC2 domain-containing protein [Prauserella cavernicola]|uniref:Zf-HC2 domain-containing protein n=1 Tax=Prauserella cavernicola TaxID=2800127 RepID=A0A934QNI7_9PSEU|nr:zf-HC2 domain-containing protein [Prauserella cavernicola]MBK1783755.1 zf-HC2 domain-containing protein [Prauserella cavernicola]
MTTNDDHYDPHGLLGAYVLDAVTDTQREQFEQHLEQCPRCGEEIDELRAAAAWLGSVVPRTPRPATREFLLDQLDRTPQGD